MNAPDKEVLWKEEEIQEEEVHEVLQEEVVEEVHEEEVHEEEAEKVVQEIEVLREVIEEYYEVVKPEIKEDSLKGL